MQSTYCFANKLTNNQKDLIINHNDDQNKIINIQTILLNNLNVI